MKLLPTSFLLLVLVLPGFARAAPTLPRAAATAHNIVIFVADGLRYGSVTPQNMPNMFKLKGEGVDFINSHSLFPTVTTLNASAIATGHYIGDTGDFGNTLYAGAGLKSMNASPIAKMENDRLLAEMNQRFAGNYLNETSLIARARAQGFATAVLGKLGPTRIQDVTASPDGNQTLLVDDNTGHPGGFGLPDWFTREMKANFLAAQAPPVSLPDYAQEVWLMKATTRIVLPHLAHSGRPFALLFWSRDPDITQHNAQDSVGEYRPGINGPSGLAAARNADSQLGALLAALKQQGLDKSTDVFVTADHGFVTVGHSSTIRSSAHGNRATALTFGFLASDLAAALHLGLFDPAHGFQPVAAGTSWSGAAGLLGDPHNPDVVVTANGGADLIYLPKANAKELAAKIITFLLTQDYVSGLFVHDRLGDFAGTLPMSKVGLVGDARTPAPAIVVNFRSFAEACPNPLQCTVGIDDTELKTGQGSHGSLSRAETRNFMAAIGPDFKHGFADPAPVSNADIAPTMARIAAISLPAKGSLKGRVIGEALVGGTTPAFTKEILQSAPRDGVRTLLERERVGQTPYFDAGGFAGKTVGLTAP